MKPQTKRFLSMILSLAFLALALAAYFYFIRPAYQDVQAAKGRRMNALAFLDYESAAIKKVKNLIDTYQGQLQIQEAVSAALPPEEDQAGALAQIYGLLQGGGLQLQFLSVSAGAKAAQPVQGAAQGGFQTKLQRSVNSETIQIKATGSYESFKAFLSRLETNIRILDLKTLGVQPASFVSQGKSFQTPQDMYSFDFTVVAYYQGR